ncbi:MAG TPA: hypothetical protein VF680_15770 [Allosphingosinicella sp.]|jgi:hypothetical protein
MPVVLDDAEADANSRVVLIRLSMLTLRCMENWRNDVRDYDQAMILVAIVAISAERLTRAALDAEGKNLEIPIAPDELAPCNISSIAAATGLNRETARRKVNELVEAGYLVKSDAGVVNFAPGRLRNAETLKMIRKQLEALTRTVSDLVRDGVLKIA